ncbi:MAG: hypothetical protein LBJ77_02005 [Holosporales bacterium]|jgi:hypothetical protein|nr:hypothetical protein [Holosporales bacterium]
MNINKELFLENVREIHLTSSEEIVDYDAIPDTDVRERLSEIIELDKALVSHRRKTLSNLPTHKEIFNKALDHICSNVVGNTMFKLLLAKAGRTKKIYLVNYDEDGSGFSPKDYAVKINLSLYDSEGVGIPSRQYYYIKKNRTLGTKLKSLEQSMFHEFCHGLHYDSRTTITKNVICAKGSNMEDAWGTDEELRTITCFNHDPICDHMFDFCQSITNGTPFHPRYSHHGWPSLEEDALLKGISGSQKFMDGWREYLVA